MPQVKVPQHDGEIRISFAGDDPVTWEVTNGQVTVSAEHLNAFLDAVAGAQEVNLPSSAKKS